MINTTSLFVGIDPSGGRKPFTYAALDQKGKIVALSGGELEEVLKFIRELPGAIVAVNAAPRPNQGLVRRDGMQQSLPPLQISGRSLDMRLAEHILRQRGINISMTPAKKELCSNWVQAGFIFYQQIDSLGFQPFPTPDSKFQWLETHPHACFCGLLGQDPLSRSLLEGRVQRQLVLYENGLEIHDPMDFYEEITRHKLLKGNLPVELIYTIEELDAIVAAYVAFVAGRHPERIMKVGDPGEGEIFLPVSQLKPKY
ncbi:MAG: DUF429 domain-containing protein [Chloroflexota bacterium]